MKLLFTCLFCLVYLTSFSQSEITGSWVGTITQQEGGYSTEYKFELYLFKKGGEIVGRSFVYLDEIYAEMDLKVDFLSHDKISFQEIRLVDFKKVEGMEWCIKNGLLRFKRRGTSAKLEGSWEGRTSFGNCIPGQVFLTRTVPRA